MSALRILVVKMGGGYLKALLPDRYETVFGRDVWEIAGRLKLIGIKEATLLVARKRKT
jgi:hypothetical protein